MKRVVLFLNGSKEDGRVVAVTHCATLTDLLHNASAKLGVDAAKLFTRHGGLIDDVHLIRDDDVLYVSEGESFISFEEKSDRGSSLNQNIARINYGGGAGEGGSTLRRQWRNPTATIQTDNHWICVDSSSELAPGETNGEDGNDDDNVARIRHRPANDRLSSSSQTPGLRPKSLPGDWIALNVGGKLFTTTRSTLTNKEPNSMLARMFAAGALSVKVS